MSCEWEEQHVVLTTWLLRSLQLGCYLAYRVNYVRHPFQLEPDFRVTSVNHDLSEPRARGSQMRTQPAFYEAVRLNAAQRWNQLERDPELAGPWHQLFKQVQSPRHVLSELLQNADDAGATKASAHIENQTFIFEHNGEDFSEEQFLSLCRFGYSNKRTLHTIGFRGIGFKSTFSLGDCIKLFTSSLAVSFHRQRFTEPQWLWEGEDTFGNGKTRVVVEITDSYRQKEIEKNLEEWLESPVSLLFFKNIRRMHIGDREVHWDSLGPGPIADSEWMALHEHEDEPPSSDSIRRRSVS